MDERPPDCHSERSEERAESKNLRAAYKPEIPRSFLPRNDMRERSYLAGVVRQERSFLVRSDMQAFVARITCGRSYFAPLTMTIG
jgi:hypothetical protein